MKYQCEQFFLTIKKFYLAYLDRNYHEFKLMLN